MIEYKGFSSTPSRLRQDVGAQRSVVLTGGRSKSSLEVEHDSVTTGGMERFSAETAIETAKAAIDGGGMS